MDNNIYKEDIYSPGAELERKKALYREACYQYYNTGEAIMTDEQFDILRENLIQSGVDVSSVGAPVSAGTKKPHEFPMLSLGKVNVYDQSGIESSNIVKVKSKLERYGCELSPDTMLLASFKLDGCSVELVYEHGICVDAITRGDGSEGISIFNKIRSRIPTKLSADWSGSLRGEVLMKKSVFLTKYADDYANPRNLVAGILGDFSLNDERVNDIDVVLYSINGLHSIISLPNPPFDSIFNWCHSFTPVKFSELPLLYQGFRDVRNKFEYPTDGIVLQLLDNQVEERVANSHEPYHMIAIKFPPEVGRTKIKSVELNLRKSGEFIPKLILEPVNLDGSTVSRCAGFNWGYVHEYKLYPGTEILIAKNGDIIPYMQGVIKTSEEPWHVETYKSGNAEILPGVGDNMPANSQEFGIHLMSTSMETEKIKIERFISQCGALEIKGFGWQTFRDLYDMVEGDFIELFNPFNLEPTVLESVMSGSKTIRKWIDAIQYVKSHMTLYWFIGMLKLPGVGWTTAKQLALRASGLEYSFSGLDKMVIKSCTEGEMYKEIGRAIKRFKEFGGVVEKEKEVIANFEATYEMTGEPNIEGFKTKADVKKFLYRWEHTGLKKTTTFLVTDSLTSTTGKMGKARKNGTTILTYAQAIALHSRKFESGSELETIYDDIIRKLANSEA